MEEREYSNVYVIPANYTDSGKLFGGMVETRNAVEAGALVILVGYPELMWIPMSVTIRIVVMTVTLIPLAVFAFMGIDGDSLLQYLGHMLSFWRNKRKLHFRRIGYQYDPKELKKPGRKGKKKEAGKA
ncbi:MAG: PrgI family protein [Oscillospiraceae bacterium]|nr:PrgI family protein [Oscillospiraceae bacterium]